MNSEFSPGPKAFTAFQGQWEVINSVGYAQDKKDGEGDLQPYQGIFLGEDFSGWCWGGDGVTVLRPGVLVKTSSCYTSNITSRRTRG